MLFDQSRKRKKVMDHLVEMYNLNEYHLRQFYEDLTCTLEDGVYHKDSPNGPCLEDQLEAAREVIYKENNMLQSVQSEDTVDPAEEEQVVDGKKITGKPIHELVLGSVRTEIISTLREELDSYFPMGDTDDFSVFDINEFPTERTDYLEYGLEKVGRIAEKLEYDKEVITEEWAQLMTYFSQQGYMCNKNERPSDSAMFWSDVLRNVAGEGYFGDTLIRFLRHIMAIPVGSSDAEASFSILKHILYDRRSTLAPAPLEDSMRIRMNGNKNPKEVDFVRYAKKWIERGHRRPEEPIKVSRLGRPGPADEERVHYQKDRRERKFRGRSKMF